MRTATELVPVQGSKYPHTMLKPELANVCSTNYEKQLTILKDFKR